jgi:hypothetical protein
VTAVIAGSIIAPLAIRGKYPSLAPGAAVSASFLVLGMILSLSAFIRKRYVPSMLLMVYAIAVFLYPVNELVVPPIERLETSKAVGLRLKPLMKQSEPLGSESNYLAGLAFYADRAPANLDRHHDMVQFMNSPGRVWVVMKEKNHAQLYDPVVNKQYVKPSYVIYKAGKRAIVTNEIPQDGKYLVKRQRP